MPGPFTPRPTVFTDPDEMSALEPVHVQPWQTETLFNHAPISEASHEYVLKKKHEPNA